MSDLTYLRAWQTVRLIVYAAFLSEAVYASGVPESEISERFSIFYNSDLPGNDL